MANPNKEVTLNMKINFGFKVSQKQCITCYLKKTVFLVIDLDEFTPCNHTFYVNGNRNQNLKILYSSK